MSSAQKNTAVGFGLADFENFLITYKLIHERLWMEYFAIKMQYFKTIVLCLCHITLNKVWSYMIIKFFILPRN